MSIPICVVGTVATDPRLTRSESRTAVCRFRLAHNERRYDRERQQWVDGETSWLTVNAFRGLAEHAAESFTKGDRVLVSGRLRVRSWESKQRSGVSTELDADALGHDLRWGVSSFTKRLVREAASGDGPADEPGSEVPPEDSTSAETRGPGAGAAADPVAA